MSLDTENLKKLAADLREYVEKRIELKAFEYQEKGSAIAAAALTNLFGVMLVFLGFFFLLVAAGLGLGHWLDSLIYGFGLLAVILIIVGTYIYKTKRNILKRKIRKLLESFLESTLEQEKKESSETITTESHG